MALTTFWFEAHWFDTYWGSLPRVRDQRELAEISVPKFFPSANSPFQKQIGRNAEDAEIAEARLWNNLDG